MKVFKCIHGLAPSYLADDCVLASSIAGKRQLRPAVCQHKDTGASPDKNCHRHQRVCCFRYCRMERLTPETTNTLLLSTNFCAKTKETPVYQLLRAHLRIFYFVVYKCTRYYYQYWYQYYYYFVCVHTAIFNLATPLASNSKYVLCITLHLTPLLKCE